MEKSPNINPKLINNLSNSIEFRFSYIRLKLSQKVEKRDVKTDKCVFRCELVKIK